MPIGVVPGGGKPFGGIYGVDTSNLDDVSKQLWEQEQKQQALHEAQALRMANLVDNTYTKIKSIDQPKFMQMITDWKNSGKELEKNQRKVFSGKRLKGDEYIKKKAEVDQKLADALAYAQGSIDDKDALEQTRKRYTINPKEFDPNAYQLMEMRMNTPLEYLNRGWGPDGKPVWHPTEKDANGVPKMIDLRDPNILMWKDNTNWGEVIKKSVGEPSVQGAEVRADDPSDPLYTNVTQYKGPKNPALIYNSIAAATAAKGGAEGIVKAFPYTADDAANITAKFDEWQKRPEVKAMYPNGITFPAGADITQAGQTAKLAAMQIAMNTPITPVTKRQPKTTAIMDKKQDQAKERMNLRQTFARENIATVWGFKEKPGITAQQFADSSYDADVAAANSNNGSIPNVDPNKKKIIFGTTFGGQGEVKMDKDGNYVLTDPTGAFTTVVVPASEAKANIIAARKSTFTPGVTNPNGNNKPVTSGKRKSIPIPTGATVGKPQSKK